MIDDDGYGRGWEYRVFSQLDTEPDADNSGRRHLHLRKVWWTERHRWTPDYPVPTDVFAIEHAPSVPEGVTAAELILELERMLKACDRPALILAEWKDREERSGDPPYAPDVNIAGDEIGGPNPS